MGFGLPSNATPSFMLIEWYYWEFFFHISSKFFILLKLRTFVSTKVNWTLLQLYNFAFAIHFSISVVLQDIFHLPILLQALKCLVLILYSIRITRNYYSTYMQWKHSNTHIGHWRWYFVIVLLRVFYLALKMFNLQIDVFRLVFFSIDFSIQNDDRFDRSCFSVRPFTIGWHLKKFVLHRERKLCSQNS